MNKQMKYLIILLLLSGCDSPYTAQDCHVKTIYKKDYVKSYADYRIGRYTMIDTATYYIILAAQIDDCLKINKDLVNDTDSLK